MYIAFWCKSAPTGLNHTSFLSRSNFRFACRKRTGKISNFGKKKDCTMVLGLIKSSLICFLFFCFFFCVFISHLIGGLHSLHNRHVKIKSKCLRFFDFHSKRHFRYRTKRRYRHTSLVKMRREKVWNSRGEHHQVILLFSIQFSVMLLNLYSVSSSSGFSDRDSTVQCFVACGCRYLNSPGHKLKYDLF